MLWFLLFTAFDVALITLLDVVIPQRANKYLTFHHNKYIPWTPLMVFNMCYTNLLFDWTVDIYGDQETAWWQFLACTPITSVMFYFIHRELHRTPIVYRQIHSVHHQFSHPQAKVVYQAHVLEQFILNILPVYVPIMIMGLNTAWATAYVTFAHINGFLAHINWYYPQAVWAPLVFDDFHLKHHVDRQVNFGLSDRHLDYYANTLASP
uniref:Fatty acid hydroxylase domain-containing protein n=1 Tax=viral metagenome TaxID=1070528 RepID=A0A6C0BNJ0_9ZZZZ